MNLKKLVSYLAIGTLSAGIALAVSMLFSNKSVVIQQTTEPALSGLPVSASGTVEDFREASRKTVDAVVHVKTSFVSQAGVYYYDDPVYDFFFGPQYRQPEQRQLGTGSGVLVSNDGYIVTNNHVIEKANRIDIVLNDRRTYQAQIVGVDQTTDLALLKIDAKDLSFLNYGNSDALEVGDWVIAVGNPFNLTSTVTAGIVSAKARNINILSNKYSIEAFIQTDAAVNPGNSGGALVNPSGELVGINTAIASNNGSFTGYSFAIPSNIVKKIVSDILEFGHVQRAYLGINAVQMDANVAKQLNTNQTNGVYISKVLDNGAAKEAGIKDGDVIVSFEQHPINTYPQLQEQISKYRPGDKVHLGLRRGSDVVDVAVVLKNKYGKTDIIKNEQSQLWGATFGELSSSELMTLGVRNGVKIVELHDGRFKNANIRQGFIITSINRQAISAPDDIINIVNNVVGSLYVEGLYPNGMSAAYIINN